jgi:hypothetical protein
MNEPNTTILNENAPTTSPSLQNTGLPSLGVPNPFNGASQWFNTLQTYADENPMLIAALGLGLILLASNATSNPTAKQK